MKSFLSVLIPVHNAQHHLKPNVEALLELLADFASEFQILVVDDASTDATDEIALELATQYVQVDHLRIARRQGTELAIEIGKRQARGEMVLQFEPSIDGAVRIEQLRPVSMIPSQLGTSDEQLVQPIPEPTPLRRGLVDRLMQWGTALRDEGVARNADANSKPESQSVQQGVSSSSHDSLIGQPQQPPGNSTEDETSNRSPKIKPRRIHRGEHIRTDR